MAGADMTVSTAAGGSTHADGHNSVPDSRDAGVAAADVTHADGYKADLVLGDADVAAADVADGDIIQAEAADNHGVPPSVTPAEKPKRKYVKSGKFVGKYNSWKQKQGLGTAAEGQDGEVPLKRKRGRPPGKQQTTATLQDPHADDSPKSIWPTNDTGKIQAATKKKRGRPQGSTRRGKPTAAALQQNCATDAQRGTPAAEQAAGMKNGDSHQSQAAEPNAEQATVAGPTDGKTDAIAGPSTDSMANGYTDSRADHQLESSSAMVRNASTGDGSRLVRNHRDTDSETIDSAVEATGAAQSAHSPGKAVPMLQNGQAAAEQAQDCLQRKEDRASGAAGAITSGTADKLRHRLSRVTGRDELGADGSREWTPIGENEGPLHHNDSTFGEYMATLERRSSSSLNRKLTGAGNTERLLEMLHGSDGWEKLVSELQQKEAEGEKAQPAATEGGQKVAGRKRGRKGDLLADTRHTLQQQAVAGPDQAVAGPDQAVAGPDQAVAGPNQAGEQQAASGATTDDSRASRPKRARAEFDYSILNGTSGNISAFIQEPDPPKAVKKRKKSKLDSEGNKPEVSVYAKAYNKVKAQFVRIRMEETLLEAYGADGHRGSAKERVKLQSEMDRAQTQVEKCKTVVRECVKFCEDAEGDKAISKDCYDSDGELPERHIFCAKCHTGDSQEDNDIVLCDGECGRAYHEQCLQPRIHASQLPEEEGWLCHACDAKADIILAINEEFGTSYDEAAPWHSLFAEDPLQRCKAGPADDDGAKSSGPVSFLNMDLGDSDPDDSSFGSEDMSDNEVAHGGPDVTEDGSAAGEASDSEADSAASSARSSGSASSTGGSSDSGSADLDEEEQEAIAGLADETGDVAAPRSKRVCALRDAGDNNSQPQFSDTSGLTPSEGTSDIVIGKRKRQHIDYKALNDSMFGNTESYEGEGLEEADVEYAPTAIPKRRKGDSDSD